MNTVTTYAYFNQFTANIPAAVLIGSWSRNLIDIAPTRNNHSKYVWINEDTLNQTIPYTQYFIYNNELYQVTIMQDIILCGMEFRILIAMLKEWAFINLSLDWAGTNAKIQSWSSCQS